MKTGVYSRKDFEIAITKSYAIVHYKIDDLFGCKLFHNNKLIAIVERTFADKDKAKYAFLNNKGQILTNDMSLTLRDKINTFNVPIDEELFFLKDEITLSNENEKTPTVSEAGVAKCLKLWTLGIEFSVNESMIDFRMQTKSLQYVFIINTNMDDIYCGISVSYPFDNGLFGGAQYFRIRNYGDNTQPWCWHNCTLGSPIEKFEFDPSVCKDGKCTFSNGGFYWPVKRYTDDEIVLQGCNDDEYVYKGNKNLVERFSIN